MHTSNQISFAICTNQFGLRFNHNHNFFWCSAKFVVHHTLRQTGFAMRNQATARSSAVLTHFYFCIQLKSTFITLLYSACTKQHTANCNHCFCGHSAISGLEQLPPKTLEDAFESYHFIVDSLFYSPGQCLCRPSRLLSTTWP